MPICIGSESRTRMEDLQAGCLWALGVGRKSHDCVPFLLGSWLILSRYRPHPSSAPVPGRVLESHLPSTGRSSCRPCIHSTQRLVKNESILWQVLFARQQGGRGGNTVDGAKGRWPEALLAGRVECLQTCYFPAQKQACKDHSCWVTPEFISQLIKEASFSPSFPFLLCISGVVHRQTRPGLVQLALA